MSKRGKLFTCVVVMCAALLSIRDAFIATTNKNKKAAQAVREVNTVVEENNNGLLRMTDPETGNTIQVLSIYDEDYEVNEPITVYVLEDLKLFGDYIGCWDYKDAVKQVHNTGIDKFFGGISVVALLTSLCYFVSLLRKKET